MFSSINPIHKKTHLILGAAAVGLGVLVAFYLVFASSPFDITFPIAELGGCADQVSCRTYCDQPENFGACTAFAAKHGLVAKNEASKIEQKVDKFVEIIQSGGGPGGCKSEEECRNYCEDPSRIDSCLEFAEKHNLIPPEELKIARQVGKVMAEGKGLPGDCRNPRACEAYCSAANHFEECVAFAEKAGIHAPEKIQGIKKAAQLMVSGQAPGGCNSREACEAYCSDASHHEECFAFGERAGFISPDEAQKFRRIMEQGGPGGCRTREACEAFCNDPAKQETCFKFAKEHGFINEEEIKHTKEGIAHFRIGLEQAPPEVAECLKANLGTNIIEDIKAGRLTPGPEIGERTRACFKTHVGRVVHPQEALQNMPPEALSCLKSALGTEFEKFQAGQIVPTPELGEKMRACFESFRPQPPAAGDVLRNAPPDVQVCLKEVLGTAFESFSSGQAPPTPELKEKMRVCYERLLPHAIEAPVPGQPTVGGFGGGPGGCRTPEECLNYCAMHKEECMNFRTGGDAQYEEKLRQANECGPRPLAPGNWICRDRGWILEGGILPGPIPPGGTQQTGCPLAPECQSAPEGAACKEKLYQLQVRYPDLKQRYPGCFSGFAPSPTRPEYCIQVITPAQDPATGFCKQFPTPCDVPAGWIKGCPSKTPESIQIPPEAINIICSDEYNPVCAANGHTYRNACLAKSAGVAVSYAGECKTSQYPGTYPSP